MKTKVKKEIKWKDSMTFPVGAEVFVTVKKETPTIASVRYNSVEKKMPTKYLYIHFEDFIEITYDVIEEAIMDGVCPSLIGQSVEPDGWDLYGFPSILLAMGLM